MWNNVNPFYGIVNNPYVVPPYMPMYGYNQPVMPGNYYMPLAGQNAVSAQNPMRFNYPKMMNLRGDQYSNYPKFKEKTEKKDNGMSSELTKELEKQIQELQKLTKEAKELAKKV